MSDTEPDNAPTPSALKVRPLKPRVLDVEVNGATSEKKWKHWKKTFQNYLEAHEAEGVTVSKLQVLVNFLSFTLYDYIEEAESYDDAIRALDEVFVKTPNEVFARHQLATSKQRPDQSMDEFLQELRRLSKNCDFKAVSKIEHRDGLIRDAFISGIRSHHIRQRLLEQSELTLDAAFRKARSLDIAQQKSASYATGEDVSTVAALPGKTDSNRRGDASASDKRDGSCFFCGSNEWHARSHCPARSVVCYRCRRVGHYAKVCRNASKTMTVTSVWETLYAHHITSEPNLSDAERQSRGGADDQQSVVEGDSNPSGLRRSTRATRGKPPERYRTPGLLLRGGECPVIRTVIPNLIDRFDYPLVTLS